MLNLIILFIFELSSFASKSCTVYCVCLPNYSVFETAKHSSGSCQAVCHAVVWQLSCNCCALVYQLSGSCQAVVTQLSGSCQAVVGQLSGKCQAVVRQLSSSCKASVKKLSGSCQALKDSCRYGLKFLIHQLANSVCTLHNMKKSQEIAKKIL